VTRPARPTGCSRGLDASDFGQLWLFAVDVGDGLTGEDWAGISRFRQRGGGLMVTRDHMDLGCSICSLGGAGATLAQALRHVRADVVRRSAVPAASSATKGGSQAIRA
jgi:hypothetical protein